MVDMYYRLVKAGKRQMTPGGPLVQVPALYLIAVQALLDKDVV